MTGAHAPVCRWQLFCFGRGAEERCLLGLRHGTFILIGASVFTARNLASQCRFYCVAGIGGACNNNPPMIIEVQLMACSVLDYVA
ncbi:hypothetical protein OH492_04760 [Vibrio chagasii]|nr:hypothetical protein [Vibrio chagasii]